MMITKRMIRHLFQELCGISISISCDNHSWVRSENRMLRRTIYIQKLAREVSQTAVLNSNHRYNGVGTKCNKSRLVTLSK